MSGRRSNDDGSAAPSPTSFSFGGDGDQEGSGLGIGKRKRGKESDKSAEVSPAGAAADVRKKPGDGEADELHEAEGDKRKRKRGGGDEGDGMEGVDAGDDGKGPGLKLRLLRTGGGGWSSKREGAEDDKGREGVSAEEKDESGKRHKVSPVPSPPGSRKDGDKERLPVHLGPDGKPVEVIPGKGEVLAKEPEVIRQRVGKAHESVDAAAEVDKAVALGEVADKGANSVRLENISQGQLVPPPVGEGEQGPAAAKGVGIPAAPPASTFRAEVHRIPAHAGWFHWKMIHSIERHALPEFFNGRSPSKTPEFYKQYRDFIINRYRENPQRLLTFTEVRRMLVGDVNALRRVFEFLDHWGLINYQASADARTQPPLWAGAPALLVESSNGSLQLTSPSISLASTVYQSKPSRAPAAKVAMSPASEEATKALSSRKNVLADAVTDTAVKSALVGAAPLTVEYHCNACSADCSQHRYHCQKQADFDLCPACFADGKYGAGVVTADFIRMDAVQGPADPSNEEWTDQETLLLLEALEIYGDNWGEIAEHVATKSKAQCMLHFVRLPIEDPFLESMERRTLSIEGPPALAADSTVSTEGKATAAGAESEPAKGGSSNDAKKPPPQLTETVTPFADAGNPVMAQVAFLASMVGPHVAAVAAQSALAALTEENPMSRHAINEGLILQASLMKPNSNATGAGAEGEQARNDTAAAGDTREEAQEDGKKAEAEPSGGPAEGKDGPERDENGQGPPSALEAKEKSKEASDDGRAVKAQEPLSSVQVRAAAATALAAAAVKAKLLADKEEEEIQRLVCTVIELQLKKLDIKLRHFDELEDMLERERGGIERARQMLYSDRLRLSAAARGVNNAARRNPPAPAPPPNRGVPAATRPPPPAGISQPQPEMRLPAPTPTTTTTTTATAFPAGAPTQAPVGAAEASVAASRAGPAGLGASTYGSNSATLAQRSGGGEAAMGAEG